MHYLDRENSMERDECVGRCLFGDPIDGFVCSMVDFFYYSYCYFGALERDNFQSLITPGNLDVFIDPSTWAFPYLLRVLNSN